MSAQSEKFVSAVNSDQRDQALEAVRQMSNVQDTGVRKALETAASKGWSDVVGATTGALGFRILAPDLITAAVNAGQQETALVIAQKITDVQDTRTKIALTAAIGKGWTNVLEAVTGVPGFRNEVGDFLATAVNENQQAVALVLANSLDGISPLTKKPLEIAAGKGWENVLQAASSLPGFGYESKEFFVAAVNGNHRETAYAIAQKITDVRGLQDSPITIALKTAAENGWVEVIEAAKNASGFARDLLQIAKDNLHKSPQPLSLVLPGFRTNVAIGNAAEVKAFAEKYAEPLKAAIKAGDKHGYQAELDRMLISAVKNAMSPTIKGDAFGQRLAIIDSLLGLGASGASQKYFALKAAIRETKGNDIGSYSSGIASRILKTLEKDTSAEKQAALNDMLKILAGGWDKEDIEGLIKLGAQPKSLGVAILGSTGFGGVEALASYFPEAERKPVLNARLMRIVTNDGEPNEKSIAALIDAGADVADKDYEAVKEAAAHGWAAAAGQLVGRIADQTIQTRVASEAAVYAARGRHLETVKTLAGRGVDVLNYANGAIGTAFSGMPVGEAFGKAADYFEPKGFSVDRDKRIVTRPGVAPFGSGQAVAQANA